MNTAFTFNPADLYSLLPVLIVFGFACAAMLFEVFAKPDASRGFIANVSVFGLLVALYFTYRQWTATEGPFSTPIFGGMMVADAYTAFFNVIFFSGAALTCLLSQRYLAAHKLDFGEYYSLVLFGAVGMSFMAGARDLIVLFIALEVMSIAVYVLTGFVRKSRRSSEAALKYFLMGAFASAILLYGMALLYGTAGSTDLAVIRRAFDANPELASSTLAKLGLVFVLVGLGFKIAIAPFHLWTPDVYEGAPAPVTAFMAVGVKAAGFAAVVRMFTLTFGIDALQFGADGKGWVGVLYLLAILTMFAGNLGALHQTNVKRMLAYSSISHAGYLLVGVVAGAFGGLTGEANSAVLYYLAGYAFSTFLAFGVIALFGKDGEEYVHLSDFAGVGFKKPFLGVALTLGVLSLAGIPPLAGFFGKFYLLKEAMEVGRPEMTWLVVIALVNSMIALYYYLRLVVFLYMKDATREVPIIGNAGATAVLVISLALVLVLGVFPDDYLEMARRSLLSLGPQ
jgi:NADH-quinone oxidoreductase subunit N